MSRQKKFGRRAGFTLIELLIVTVVFGVVLTGALGFMTIQQKAFFEGSDQLMTLQNLRYAYQTLEIDLTTLGSNVPAGQPSMVLADDDVIAFTGDYTSNLANDVSAVYIDPDAPSGMVQVPRVKVNIPNSPFAWPDTIYRAPGAQPAKNSRPPRSRSSNARAHVSFCLDDRVFLSVVGGLYGTAKRKM